MLLFRPSVIWFTFEKGPLQGQRLKINATVDLDGIAKLKEMLTQYEEILKLMQ